MEIRALNSLKDAKRSRLNSQLIRLLRLEQTRGMLFQHGSGRYKIELAIRDDFWLEFIFNRTARGRAL